MEIRVNPKTTKAGEVAPEPVAPEPGASLRNYLYSLPERTLRSATAVTAGLLREFSDAVLPAAVRRTKLYSNMVEVTLRYLIEQVGEVEGTYSAEGRLSHEFLIRRTAGNGIEVLGILAFRASPVWVMAALADVSGAGRRLVREITETLAAEGLLEPGARFETVEGLLEGLEQTSGKIADAINTPPLDIATLRAELTAIRGAAQRIPDAALPSPERLGKQWQALKSEAAAQGRSVSELSAAMALAAIRDLPEDARWLSRSVQSAGRRTGRMVSEELLEHYSRTLGEIREQGFLPYWQAQFRPYLHAAAAQFSRQRRSLTERLLDRRRK